MSTPLDWYSLELEALSEDEHKQLPIRAIATNIDDETAVEERFTREQTRAFLLTKFEPAVVDYYMQQLQDHHHYVDLVAQIRSIKGDCLIFVSQELVKFGFDPDELRPTRDALKSYSHSPV